MFYWLVSYEGEIETTPAPVLSILKEISVDVQKIVKVSLSTNFLCRIKWSYIEFSRIVPFCFVWNVNRPWKLISYSLSKVISVYHHVFDYFSPIYHNVYGSRLFFVQN